MHVPFIGMYSLLNGPPVGRANALCWDWRCPDALCCKVQRDDVCAQLDAANSAKQTASGAADFGPITWINI